MTRTGTNASLGRCRPRWLPPIALRQFASPEVERGFVQAATATKVANAQAAGAEIRQGLPPELFPRLISMRTFAMTEPSSKKGNAPS